MTHMYKPGDRAWRINFPNYAPGELAPHAIQVGDIITVVAVNPTGVYDTDGVYHEAVNLEPAPALPEPALPETKRGAILREADRIIHGDREKDYGAPIDSFRRLAAAINIVLEGVGHAPVDPVTAAKLMIALKFSRLAGGDNKDDTWVDLAGYAALGAEVRDQQ